MVGPEARLGFWSLAFLLRIHQGDTIRAAVDVADEALKEFEFTAKELSTNDNPTTPPADDPRTA